MNFYRTLTPRGTFIITFDLSLDGSNNINIAEGEKLLYAVTKKFINDFDNAKNNKKFIKVEDDIFTTITAQEINKNLFPWQKLSCYQLLKSILKFEIKNIPLIINLW